MTSCVSIIHLTRILHHFQDTAHYWSNFCWPQGVPVVNALFGGKLLNSVLDNLASRNQNTPVLYDAESILICWAMTRECDGQTDGLTDLVTANAALHCAEQLKLKHHLPAPQLIGCWHRNVPSLKWWLCVSSQPITNEKKLPANSTESNTRAMKFITDLWKKTGNLQSITTMTVKYNHELSNSLFPNLSWWMWRD